MTINSYIMMEGGGGGAGGAPPAEPTPLLNVKSIPHPKEICRLGRWASAASKVRLGVWGLPDCLLFFWLVWG